MFIVIEGIDGAGKSSAIKSIKNFLKDEDAIIMSMPSKNETGLIVRKEITNDGSDDFKVKDLFADDFKYTIDNVIKPALEEGRNVVCDRYIYSFIAYQSVSTSEEAVKHSLREINVIKPDLVFLMDIDPRISLKRLSREKDSIEKKGINFFDDVRNNFIRLAKINKDIFKIVDASKSIDEVNKECLQIISNKIKSSNE